MKKLLLIIPVLIIVPIIIYYHLIYRVIPSNSPIIKIKNSKINANIKQDNWGIPHIYSQEENHAYFALGYKIASERLFQMDIQRRVANGELSEILGSKMLPTDKKLRSLRFKKSITEKVNNKDHPINKNKKMWSALKSYFDGVNFFIKNNPLPIEFILLRYSPKPFSPIDSFAFSGYMGYSFATSVTKDILFSTLLEKLPATLFHDLEKRAKQNTINFKVLSTIAPLTDFDGSNAWVLSGKRTKSRKPILASDPHISFSLPGVWYEAHIKTPTHEIYGHYLPLIPFPALGHNKYIGWGLTMSKVDDMDFYAETFSKDKKKVMYKNSWVKIKSYKEIINIKGQKPVEIEIKLTPHGPIMDYVLDKKNISMKWSYYEPDNLALDTLYLAERAKNWGEFKNAFSFGAAPGLHIAYADSSGNIGSLVYGKIPNREHLLFSNRILNGANGENEYSYYKYSQNPKLFNPKSGQIVLANARQNIPEKIAGFWSPTDRFDTIANLLNKQDKWSIEDTKKLQTKSFAQSSKVILPILLNSIKSYSLSTTEKSAIKYLNKWNHLSEISSVGASIYHYWNISVKKLLFDELTDTELNNFCKLGEHWTLYKKLLSEPQSRWWDSISSKQKIEDKNEIVYQAFKLTMSKLNNLNNWEWGDIHQLEFQHPLGKKRPLNLIFNLGPYKSPGGYEQINNLKAASCSFQQKIKAGPSTRRIIDFNSPELSFGILPIGNSGHLASEHYNDQSTLYFNNKYRNQLMNKESIEKVKRKELIFSP